MRGLLRCSLVWLLALSFAAGGVAARQCAAEQPATAGGVAHTQMDRGHHGPALQQAAHAAHDHAAHDHAAMSRDHAAASHGHASGDTVPMSQDDHACAKCCGTCTLVMGMTPQASTIAIFKVSPASFPAVSGHCCGTTAAVDPGIPKRII